MASPWAADMAVIPTGMRKATTAIAAEIAREMIAHQWVVTLKAPMRMKKTIRGARPTTAVRSTLPPTAVVDGVKDAGAGPRSGRASDGMSKGMMTLTPVSGGRGGPNRGAGAPVPGLRARRERPDHAMPARVA